MACEVSFPVARCSALLILLQMKLKVHIKRRSRRRTSRWNGVFRVLVLRARKKPVFLHFHDASLNDFSTIHSPA